jgi:hypothetical protein
MSMSAFQNTAPLASQTATDSEAASSSVLYLPFDTCRQPVVFASNSAAVGAATAAARPCPTGADAEATAEGITVAASTTVANRISFLIISVALPLVRKRSLQIRGVRTECSWPLARIFRMGDGLA